MISNPFRNRRLLIAVVTVLLAVLTLPGHRAKAQEDADADAAKKEMEELLKQYKRLTYERYYRHPSTLYDRVLRYSQMDPETMNPVDQYLQAFYDGDWDEVRQTLQRLPLEFSERVYGRMLEDLAGRYVPVLTLDDFVGLADACPGEFNSDRIRKLGLLLRIAVAPEQEHFLRQALKKGSRRLGQDGEKRLITGRILMHAEFDALAREYLPSVTETEQIEDVAVRDEVLSFLASQEELEEFEQTRIGRVWEQQAAMVTDPANDDGKRQEAADQLAQLLGKTEAASFEPWIRGLMQKDPDAVIRLAIALGKRSQGRLTDSDVPARSHRLAAQKVLLLCAAEKADLARAPWNGLAVAMADWWIQEAEHTFTYHPSYREVTRERPHVVPGELLGSAPEDAWADALPGSMRERVDVCLSKAVLVSDRYDDAAQLILEIAARNPGAGVSLAEEYLKAWAYRHDPQVPEEIRKKYALGDDARIAVTPIMMEKNIAGLAKMMDLFRKHGISPANGELLAAAFDVCYSNAEVYRRTHIERVFGPVDKMNGDIFYQMIRMMTEGLSSRWRTMEVQLDVGTRRTQQETLEMVRTGYETAIAMIDERAKTDPENWHILTLAGSLMSDWGDFEYYQQLVGDASADRLAAFREKNNASEAYFTRAAKAYAGQVEKLRSNQHSIDVYLAWFHSILGINSDGRLNLAKPMDRRALNALREAIRSLPGDLAQAHVNQFAKHIQTRVEDTEDPLHEELKYKYLTGSLVVTKESPFAFQTGEKVAYYDELLEETRLTTRVDGPNTIYRDHEFGIILSVDHTEALGRMADFGKYLVNDLPPLHSPQRRAMEQNLVPTYRVGELQGRRDQLEMNIREALELFFDVKAIAFSPKDVQPRPTDQPGWEETVLAYIHVKAKDASVDKIPSIQMTLEFLDLTGPVKIITQSAETMIRITDQPTPPRPFSQVDLSLLLDPRTVATTEEIQLEIKASARGLVPELDELLQLKTLPQTLPILRIDPREGVVLRQVNSWGDTVHAVSERQWTVALDASALLEPPRQVEIELPQPKGEAAAAYEAYVGMDLVDLEEPRTTVGEGETVVAASDLLGGDDRQLLYVAAGSAGVLLILVLLFILIRTAGSRERPLRARDVFQMPAEIDPFVVVQLLRALDGSQLVRMSSAKRTAMLEDAERIQRACFGNNGTPELTEAELRDVARKWLRVAR